MPGGLGSDPEPEPPRRHHGGGDVLRVGGDHDGARMLIDQQLPRPAGVVPAGVAREEDVAAHPAAQRLEVLARKCGRT